MADIRKFIELVEKAISENARQFSNWLGKGQSTSANSSPFFRKELSKALIEDNM